MPHRWLFIKQASRLGSPSLKSHVQVPDADIPQAAFRLTGAYGRTMASNYNQALIPAVVGVGEAGAHVMIRRQTIDDLLSWDVSE